MTSTGSPHPIAAGERDESDQGDHLVALVARTGRRGTTRSRRRCCTSVLNLQSREDGRSRPVTHCSLPKRCQKLRPPTAKLALPIQLLRTPPLIPPRCADERQSFRQRNPDIPNVAFGKLDPLEIPE